SGNHVLTYRWTVREAPPEAATVLTGEQMASRQFEFTPRVPGRYVFELRVSDGPGRESVPVSVEVMASPPQPLIVTEPEPAKPFVLPNGPAIKPNVQPNKPKAIAHLGEGKRDYKVGDTIYLDGS